MNLTEDQIEAIGNVALALLILGIFCYVMKRLYPPKDSSDD